MQAKQTVRLLMDQQNLSRARQNLGGIERTKRPAGPTNQIEPFHREGMGSSWTSTRACNVSAAAGRRPVWNSNTCADRTNTTTKPPAALCAVAILGSRSKPNYSYRSSSSIECDRWICGCGSVGILNHTRSWSHAAICSVLLGVVERVIS